MRNSVKIITAALLFMPFTLQATEEDQKDTLKVSLYFRTNTTRPTVESRQNIERAISVIPMDTDIVDVFIDGWASPEGTNENNRKIAEVRASAAEMFLREYFTLPDNISRFSGTDWQGMVDFSRKYFNGKEMEAIAGAVELPLAQRKEALMKIRGGHTWKELNSEIFPLLRRADISIVYRKSDKNNRVTVSSTAFGTYIDYNTSVIRKDTIVISHKDTVYYMPYSGKRRDPLKVRALYPTIDREMRRPIVGVRSNLLLPLLNVGVEYPIGNRWSVAADFYYPWCPRTWMDGWTTPKMTCIQGSGGFIEGRYWFGLQHRRNAPDYGKYRLLGHSLGLLAGSAFYDIEFDGVGQQGEIFVAGLGYTYAIPLGKKGGVHLEFDVAVGAVYRIWHPYGVHNEGGYLLRQKDENNMSIESISSWSILPIKAGVNLSVPIFEQPKKKTSRRK